MKKIRMNSKNRDQKSCLFARSINFSNTALAILIFSLLLLVEMLLLIFFASFLLGFLYLFPLFSFLQLSLFQLQQQQFMLIFVAFGGNSDKIVLYFCYHIAGRAITMQGEIQNRSHETIYKPSTKNVAKLEEQYLNGEQQRKVRYCYCNMGKRSITK